MNWPAVTQKLQDLASYYANMARDNLKDDDINAAQINLIAATILQSLQIAFDAGNKS
jgi:hypothetical protein